MTSIWSEADHAARTAIEAELRRRNMNTPAALSEALRRIGQAVSVKALTLMAHDRSGQQLALYVRESLPA